jgi:hypothetical protein
MQQMELPAYEAEILARLGTADESVLTPAAAEGILAITFSPVDKHRMHDLAAKAHSEMLTSEEQREIEAYSRISSLLGIIKSKARRSLKRRIVNGKAKAH